MRKFFILAVAAAALSACHEDLEDRAAREAREFTRKNCPMPVAEFIVNDSMVYERATRTIHYYYTVKGAADTMPVNWDFAGKELIKGVKDATSIRAYKDAGFNFAYTYFSERDKRKVLVDVVVTPKEYN